MKKLYLILAIALSLDACAPQSYDEEGLRDINGTQLYVKAIGQGEPILIVHGGPGFSHRYMRQWLIDLSENYLVIFYDQRASGESQIDGVEGSSISLQNFVEDMDAIREVYGLKKLTVLAHSWGGILGMRYAMAYPERTKSLILVNSVGATAESNNQANVELAGRLTDEDREARGELVQSEAFRNREISAIESLMKIGFKVQFYDTEFLDALQLQLSDQYMTSSSLMQNLASDLNQYDFRSELREVNVPTMLLYGNYDPLASWVAPELDSLLPNSQLQLIEQSGHFPFVETNEVFLEMVRSFLQDL